MKIFLDNTMGQPMAHWLAETARRWHKGEPVEVVHKLDRFPPNTPDDVWVPLLAESDWVVISADLGRRRPRLHEVCRDHNKNLIELSGTCLRGRGTFEWIRAVLHIWPLLMTVTSNPKARRYKLSYSDSTGTKFKCVEHPWWKVQ